MRPAIGEFVQSLSPAEGTSSRLEEYAQSLTTLTLGKPEQRRAEWAGRHTAVAVPAGGFLTSGQLADPAAGGRAGPGLRPGERVADVVAVGAADAIGPGGRVDVLVTREGQDGGEGGTSLALEDVEVLAAAPAPLRVTLRQAVHLVAAQSFAREIRFLSRAPGDRGRAQGLAIGAGLG